MNTLQRTIPAGSLDDLKLTLALVRNNEIATRVLTQRAMLLLNCGVALGLRQPLMLNSGSKEVLH